MRKKTQTQKEVTPWRASRKHYGPNHWHAEVRSTVIVCRQCRYKVPKFEKPESCPECGEGKLMH